MSQKAQTAHQRLTADVVRMVADVVKIVVDVRVAVDAREVGGVIAQADATLDSLKDIREYF